MGVRARPAGGGEHAGLAGDPGERGGPGGDRDTKQVAERSSTLKRGEKMSKSICKVSSCTNTPAPQGVPVFICRHLNEQVDVRLHEKHAYFGNLRPANENIGSLGSWCVLTA